MKRKGFTLIELIASLAIFSLLTGSIYIIFSMNLRASKNIYENENSFKEATIAIIYIENILKSAYKIELTDDTGESNIKAYVLDRNSNQISSIYFKTLESNNGKRYLMAVRDNISNKSESDGTVRISECDNLHLYLDVDTGLAKIIINKNNKNSIQSKIYLGDRL